MCYLCKACQEDQLVETNKAAAEVCRIQRAYLGDGVPVAAGVRQHAADVCAGQRRVQRLLRVVVLLATPAAVALAAAAAGTARLGGRPPPLQRRRTAAFALAVQPVVVGLRAVERRRRLILAALAAHLCLEHKVTGVSAQQCIPAAQIV